MKNVSSAFKNELKKGNRKYIKSLKLTLNDGTELLVDNSKLWQNGVKIDRSTSSSSSFDIGSVIIGQLTVTLSNINDDYSEYDFTDCVASDVKVGLELPGGTIESLTYGKFYLDEAKYNGSIITLSFYDSIYKFDKNYSESNLIYPATLGQIVRDACSVCGVTLQTTSFDHDDYVVQQRPNDESLTFRQVLQWVGQIACLYCMADEQGRLCLQWYDTDLLESIDLSEDIPDNPTGYHHIHSFTSLSTGLDDVVITGISVTQDVESDDGTVQKTYQSGTDGYVLSISKNKLIQGEAGITVASMIGEKIIGMRFRTFSASTLSDPTVEAGDVVVLTSRKGEKYKSVITNNIFQPGNFQSMSCGAVAPARKSASRYSEITQVYVDYRKDIQKEKSDREQAIEELGNRINSSSGVFTTIERQDDGSNIYYLHNKPSLSESDMIWKMTAEAWGVSTDGGKTYNAGMTVDGDTIVRILTATGVNADWIDTGEIQVSDDEGNTIFSVNIDTKQVFISGDSVRIGSKSATEAINEALEAAQNAGGINLQLDNDFQGISTDYEGNISGSIPECKTTAQVFYGQTDITNNCVFTTTKSASITGSWNNQTKTYTVTGLSADSGWVDIKATYLTTISVTKRFGIEKVKGGVPGQDGTNGTDGVNGVGVLSTEVTYQASYSGTTFPTGEWLNSIPQVSAGQYLWTRTEFNFSDDSTIYTYSVSRMGENGTNGEDGSDGLGILSTEVRYQASSSGTTEPSGTWYTSVPSVPEGQYLWTRTVITYTDYTTTTSYSVGRMGKDGAQGIPGDPGEDGKTSYFHIKYSAVSNPTSSSQMTETPNAYIGTYVDFTQADSNDPSDYTWAKFRGDNGADGIPGTNGENGQTSYLHIAYANNSTGTLDFSTTNSTNKTYIGQYVDFIKSDSNSPSKYNWTKIKGDDGQDGQDGQPGRTFFIEPSATVLKRSKDNVISPDHIEFTAYYRDGENATRYTYSGRWIIDETTDGNRWTEIYRSTSNESSVLHYVYNLLSTGYDSGVLASSNGGTIGIPRDVSQIRARLYAAGGFTTMIDLQTVAVVTDADSLEPLEILEIISQGMEGIYSPDGIHYYINASAIKSGVIEGIEIISNNGNDWMKMSQSLLTGGYGSTTDGLLDLSANYSSGARKVVLESKTDDVVLKSAKEFRVQRQTGEMGYLVQSGGTDYFEEVEVIFGDTYPIIGIMYGEDDNGGGFLDIRLANGQSAAVFSNKTNNNPTLNTLYVTGLSQFYTPPKIYNLTHVSSGGHLVFASDGATLAYLASSSKRYKDHVSEMSYEEAEKLLELPVVSFKYKDGYLAEDDVLNGKAIPGFYAEDVEEVFPEGVQYNADGEPEDWNYRTMIPAMMKIIQKQSEDIEELKKEISELKGVK